jgi:hypothetical protein
MKQIRKTENEKDSEKKRKIATGLTGNRTSPAHPVSLSL